jgi:type III pantothenate kinase
MNGILIAIDIGNTTTQIGGFENDHLAFSFRLASTHTRTQDEASLLVRQILREADLEPTKTAGAVIASVVPVLTPVFQMAVATACGRQPLIVSHRCNLEIELAVPFPEQVGADRIANAEGFWTEHHSAGIVVDFGTATTFDVISPSGAYIGGAIAPGLETSAERLSQKGAQLFKVGFGPPSSAIGHTTEDALKVGLFYGSVGAVDEIVRRIKTAMDADPPVIATGGLAEVVAQESQAIQSVDPILTLKGLKAIFAKNS